MPALQGVEWSAQRFCRFNRSKDPVPTVHKDGWASGPVWACAENLDRTGVVLQTSKDVASFRTDCAVPAAIEYGLLSICKNVAIKVRMIIVFCHVICIFYGHCRSLRTSPTKCACFCLCLHVAKFMDVAGLRK